MTNDHRFTSMFLLAPVRLIKQCSGLEPNYCNGPGSPNSSPLRFIEYLVCERLEKFLWSTEFFALIQVLLCEKQKKKKNQDYIALKRMLDECCVASSGCTIINNEGPARHSPSAFQSSFSVETF